MQQNLMTIDDLAAHWKMSVSLAKRTVKRLKIPRVSFGESTYRINWALTRFPADAIARWEQESLREPVEDLQAPKDPKGTAGKDWYE